MGRICMLQEYRPDVQVKCLTALTSQDRQGLCDMRTGRTCAYVIYLAAGWQNDEVKIQRMYTSVATIFSS